LLAKEGECKLLQVSGALGNFLLGLQQHTMAISVIATATAEELKEAKIVVVPAVVLAAVLCCCCFQWCHATITKDIQLL